MLKQTLAFNRADRVSAVGRIALALPTLAAAIVDRPRPESSAAIVVGLLAAYAAIALVAGTVIWARRLSARPVGQWLHGLDMVVFAALLLLTGDIASPFFPLYLFAILSATLRWEWRGALGTAAAIALIFVPMALLHPGGLDPERDDLLRYIVRIGQVIVVGAMLAYIGRQRERSWRELLRLSQPVTVHASSVEVAIAACLDHVRVFFDVPRAIFIWKLRDAPGWRSLQTGAGPQLTALAPDYCGPVAADIADIVFEFRAGSSELRCCDAEGRLTTVNTALFDPELARDWRVSEAVVAAIAGDAFKGWLVIPRRVVEEDLYLARALAVQLVAAIDHAAAAETWRAAAASEERVRVAHDLHDGILQFLTGLALQLRLIAQQNGHDPEAVAERIRTLTAALQREQQDLRQVLEAIRPRSNVGSPQTLAALGRLLGDQWNISVAITGPDPSPALANDIHAIIREAIANAVRHGAAHQIGIRGAGAADGYRLEIVDNGRGFGLPGHFNSDDLRRRRSGPQSILERVARLGGVLTLDTSAAGTTLAMIFPQATFRSAA
jgi:signal transduction histidine kinase